MAEMNLSTKQYERLEEEAYVQLAARLVELSQSPCGNRTEQYLLDESLVVELILSESNVLRGVLRVLHGVGPERGFGLAIQKSFPNAQRLIEERASEVALPSFGLGVYASLFYRTVLSAFPETGREDRRVFRYPNGILVSVEGEFLPRRAFCEMVSGGTLNWNYAHTWVYSTSQWNVNFAELRDYQTPTGEVGHGYFMAKGNSETLLLKAAEILEEEDAWSLVLGDTNDREQILV